MRHYSSGMCAAGRRVPGAPQRCSPCVQLWSNLAAPLTKVLSSLRSINACHGTGERFQPVHAGCIGAMHVHTKGSTPTSSAAMAVVSLAWEDITISQAAKSPARKHANYLVQVQAESLKPNPGGGGAQGNGSLVGNHKHSHHCQQMKCQHRKHMHGRTWPQARVLQ